jgi:hypothetical protein
MSERTDTETGRANSGSLSRETVVFELARASYALGIGGVALTALVFVVYFLGFGGRSTHGLLNSEFNSASSGISPSSSHRPWM